MPYSSPKDDGEIPLHRSNHPGALLCLQEAKTGYPSGKGKSWGVELLFPRPRNGTIWDSIDRVSISSMWAKLERLPIPWSRK